MDAALAEKHLVTDVTVRARASFLDALKASPNVTAAAEAAGISRMTAYRWRGDDEAFAAAWDDAIEQSVDRLEEKVWKRAEAGESDRLAEILLKAHRPKYREKQQIEHTGTIQHDHQWVDAELKALGLRQADGE